MKAIAIIATYGPTSYGDCGFDSTTKGSISPRFTVSILNGLNWFEDLLRSAADQYGLERGDMIEISVVPVKCKE